MLGLYIHIPFCKGKCIYCDFPTIITKSQIYFQEYIQYLKQEMSIRLKRNKKVKTIYIGGGTPSFIGEKLISQLVDSITKYVNLSEILEFTIEANPEDITTKLAKTIKNNHITRVSLGIQSMNQKDLETLSRTNSPQDNERAIKTLQDNGITNINCDIIFDIPNSPKNNLINTLEKLVSFDVPHISAYGLTVEEYTPLSVFVKNSKIKLKNNFEEEFYTIHEFLSRKGYIHYEISNYSKPKFQSKHNLIYWNRKEYIGIGIGACGFVDNKRYQNEINLKRYKEKIQQNIEPSIYQEQIDNIKKFEEIIMLGFRKKEGFSLKSIKNVLNQNELQKFNNKLELFKNTYLDLKNGKVIPKLKGWVFSDYIIRELITL
ncbi:MAG: radical SAM family heme chaperone HemW [Brevinematia bacterium]